jgi:hypothetical protein
MLAFESESVLDGWKNLTKRKVILNQKNEEGRLKWVETNADDDDLATERWNPIAREENARLNQVKSKAKCRDELKKLILIDLKR